VRDSFLKKISVILHVISLWFSLKETRTNIVNEFSFTRQQSSWGLPCAKTRRIGVSPFRSNLLSSAACSDHESHITDENEKKREREKDSRTLSLRWRACVCARASDNAVNKTCLLAREPKECNDLRHCDVAFTISWQRGTRRLLIARAFVRFTTFEWKRLLFSSLRWCKNTLNVKIALLQCKKYVSRTNVRLYERRTL